MIKKMLKNIKNEAKNIPYGIQIAIGLLLITMLVIFLPIPFLGLDVTNSFLYQIFILIFFTVIFASIQLFINKRLKHNVLAAVVGFTILISVIMMMGVSYTGITVLILNWMTDSFSYISGTGEDTSQIFYESIATACLGLIMGMWFGLGEE